MFLQQVINCLYIQENKALLLQKSTRNWWVAPGGKVEPGESLVEACLREYSEETGLVITNLKLMSIFTIIVKQDAKTESQWMFYNFYAEEASGVALQENAEGKLKWFPVSDILDLPMAAGDRVIIKHILNPNRAGVLIGTMTYTEDYELLDIRYSEQH